MKHLKKTIHSSIETLEGKSILKRPTARAITIKGDEILLLFTKRYQDYSLPGGGIDEGEDPISGMIRELEEETGAQSISEIKEFGIYEEYRPWNREGYEILHIISYCYTCKISEELGVTNLEKYEVNNGMEPVWISIDEAIKHNENTIKNSSKKGMSIERETFLLNLIKDSVY